MNIQKNYFTSFFFVLALTVAAISVTIYGSHLSQYSYPIAETLVAFISEISVLAGIATVLYFLANIIQFLREKQIKLNYLLFSRIVTQSIVVFVLSLFILIGIIILSWNDTIYIDGAEYDLLTKENFLRTVLFFGLVTALSLLISKYIKKYTLSVSILVIYWLLGSILTLGLVTIDYSSFQSTESVQSNSKEVFALNTSRNSCDRTTTLQQVKSCTFLITRDDGGHGSAISLSDGYLITNRHVVEDAKILTTWYDSKEYELEVWNYSDELDIAILTLPEDLSVETCSWFDSEYMDIAEDLYTVGWPNEPYGESTVTKGIYSRTVDFEDNTEYIQTDAPINPGNSGGALVNECGVVGINTAKQSWVDDYTPSEGYGFALSSRFIQPVVIDLIENGSLSKEIPESGDYFAEGNSSGKSYSTTTYEYLEVGELRRHVNDIYRAKASWEGSSDVDQAKLNKLIDLFNRQIEFCNHLINKLSDGSPASQDDIYMWNTIVDMSHESLDLARELNGY